VFAFIVKIRKKISVLHRHNGLRIEERMKIGFARINKQTADFRIAPIFTFKDC